MAPSDNNDTAIESIEGDEASEVAQSHRTGGRPPAPAQVQHAQMVQHQSPYPQMPQSSHMAQHHYMGYPHPHQVTHSSYMYHSSHQTPQSPNQIPQGPHSQMAQSPNQITQSPHPQMPLIPYMAYPHCALQPGYAPTQSPLFTPQGTPIMAPQQSPLFTPLATPTPTLGPQSAATTPAPSSVAFAWNPSPQYVSSTPVPYPAASTPAPEYSSGGQVTDDMGPPPKKKRTPKPKPLSEREMLRATPIVLRKQASHSKRKKDEVVTWMPTGVSSGIGFEAVKQLLSQSQPYRVILGARNTKNAQKAYGELKFDRESHGVTVLPLELNDLKGVKSFAEQTLDKIGKEKIDYLLLNAGLGGVAAEGPGPHGSKWCESHVVNHLSQHYLVHLLREKLVESKSRIVFVSSGAIRRVSDPSVLDTELKAGSGASASTTYCNTKFTGLLGAQWWRRQLAGTNDVVAVSPGLIPGTGLANRMGIKADMADAKSIPEGAQSVLAAMTRSDFPEDRDRIFLTSWGEWWEKSVIENSTDKELQDKWCPSKEDIERQADILS
ncbi:unnamed protein product [Fusarium fujikuroi]|uniref:WW domain-containing oxidoreductase n=1 Tax=Fusarium fujikuroi TaxID=5127 RepID=A0A9Q9RNL3_FUSFU|nr:unnamed protein product [Fusarium fujikuroi]VTT81553.1 unnamed protein product [Fusarium fujikuroi]